MWADPRDLVFPWRGPCGTMEAGVDGFRVPLDLDGASVALSPRKAFDSSRPDSLAGNGRERLRAGCYSGGEQVISRRGAPADGRDSFIHV